MSLNLSDECWKMLHYLQLHYHTFSPPSWHHTDCSSQPEGGQNIFRCLFCNILQQFEPWNIPWFEQCCADLFPQVDDGAAELRLGGVSEPQLLPQLRQLAREVGQRGHQLRPSQRGVVCLLRRGLQRSPLLQTLQQVPLVPLQLLVPLLCLAQQVDFLRQFYLYNIFWPVKIFSKVLRSPPWRGRSPSAWPGWWRGAWRAGWRWRGSWRRWVRAPGTGPGWPAASRAAAPPGQTSSSGRAR